MNSVPKCYKIRIQSGKNKSAKLKWKPLARSSPGFFRVQNSSLVIVKNNLADFFLLKSNTECIGVKAKEGNEYSLKVHAYWTDNPQNSRTVCVLTPIYVNT